MMNQNPTDERPIPVTITVTLTALVHPEPRAGGYSAEVPALPGCYTQGETLDEVRANLQEAAEGWLAAAHDSGLAGPAVREGAA
jgi:predicted RNase H-like HicB family nuclease